MPFSGIEILVAVGQTIIGLVFGSGLVVVIFKQLFFRISNIETALKTKVDAAYCTRQANECARNFVRGEHTFTDIRNEQKEILKAQRQQAAQLSSLITEVRGLTYEVRREKNRNHGEYNK